MNTKTLKRAAFGALLMGCALPLAGCIYGDKASSWAIAVTNECSHDITATLSTGSFDARDFNLAAHREDPTFFRTLDPGEGYGFWGMEGEPAVATLVIISDTDARFISVGEDAGSTNDYTITGDDCLPALTGALETPQASPTAP